MPTYTPPSTWASGTVVRSTFLDVQVKGNMEYMGTTHRHSTGTAGEGAGYLGPITYLDNLGAAVPSAPTNSTIARVFATATSLGWRASNSSTFYFGDTLHEHSIASVSAVYSSGARGSVGSVNASWFTMNFGSASTGTASTAITVGGSGSRAIVVMGGASIGNFTSTAAMGTQSTLRIEIQRDGVIIATREFGGTNGGTRGGANGVFSTLLTNVASGSVTYSVTARRKGGGVSGGFAGCAISVLEVKQS